MMINYEENIKKLNEILKRLEDEKLSVAESVKLYETAENLYKECAEYLENAKGSFYKIRQELDTFNEEKMN